MRDSIKETFKENSFNIFLPIFSCYLFRLLILSYKFKSITLPHMDFRINSQLSFWHTIQNILYPRLFIVFPNYHWTWQSSLYNSSGNEKRLRDNNLQLTKLQFYINNITRCIDIVNLISARIQYHQWYTLIKCDTIFTIQLSTNYNYIHQYYILLLI